MPFNRAVTVEAGTTLLEAVGKARIAIDSACGGDGICGRCKMIVKHGRVGGDVSALLTREEIRRGVVLACQTTVQSDLQVEIPEDTRAREKIVIDREAQRFRAMRAGTAKMTFARAPLVSKVHLELSQPTLENNDADCQRIQDMISRLTGIDMIQTGLKVIRSLPGILRAHDFSVTATVGRRRGVGEIMELEGGDASEENYMAIVDAGTSTVVVHLVKVGDMTTVDAQACFNSQATFGREVTARIMAAEKHGAGTLQRILVDDINRLISSLAAANDISLRNITAVACAGNTTMIHFLLGLPPENIRRRPYIAVTSQAPPFRAAEVGLKINPRGLLYTVPGIGAWVGGDLTAGILATGLHEFDGTGMLVDFGTNGEIIVGNRDWLMACSASAGPALEGAGVECGMIAQHGAIESVAVKDQGVALSVIGGGKPDGICGSGIIDAIACLLRMGIIDRSGKFVESDHPRVDRTADAPRYVLARADESLRGKDVFIAEDDIQNVITAKAAIFAAARIMLKRLDLQFSDINRLFIAGGFGSYIDLNNAIAIGLLPDLPLSDIVYVGNTSIWGAKLAAFSEEARMALREIATRTTYYDLMGSSDYVEQFQQAMFLPHTDIELYPSQMAGGMKP